MGVPNINGLVPISIGRPSIKFLQAMGVPMPQGSNRPTPKEVSLTVNQKILFVSDLQDEWSNPLITLWRGSGDCEDFVLLKRALLLSVGWKDEDLVMLVGYDKVLREEHAVLLVRIASGWIFLDNRNDLALRLEKLTDFTPVKAYTATNSWLYGSQR